MKKIYFKLIFTFIISSVIFISCNSDSENDITKQNTENNTETLKLITADNNTLDVSQQFGNQIYSFFATKKNDIITSKFTIQNLKSDLIFQTDFIVDKSIEHYKLYQADKVIAIANNLKYDLNLDDYAKIDTKFKLLFSSIAKKSDVSTISSLLYTMYFHNSIVNAKKRSLQNQTDDCGCTLHPGYLLEKTGFFCQEDFTMNVDNIRNTISHNKDMFTDAKSISLDNYLKTVTSETITFDKVYSFYVDKGLYLETLDNIKRGCGWWCVLGCGSDWGCCGNYSGCCLFSSPICYIHDAMCTDCEPEWFCLPGCVPD